MSLENGNGIFVFTSSFTFYIPEVFEIGALKHFLSFHKSFISYITHFRQKINMMKNKIPRITPLKHLSSSKISNIFIQGLSQASLKLIENFCKKFIPPIRKIYCFGWSIFK